MAGHEQDEDGSERRKHLRVHTRIEIPYWKYVKVKRDQDVHIGFVKNLSKGGFFIESEMVYKRGEEIGFEFYLPNSPQALIGVARVAWCKPYDEMNQDPTQPAGMGLEFLRFDGEAETILLEFIDTEVRKQGPAGKA